MSGRREAPPQSRGVGSFREDLDLSGIVDKFEIFGGDPRNGLPTYIRERADEEDLWAPPPIVMPGEGPEPDVAGAGPLECSTSRQIAPQGSWWAWDPNHLYRCLGVSWPHAGLSRKGLMKAYQSVDGQSSVRATFAFKMLLNTEFRQMYDALPLGECWMEDPVVQDALRKRASIEASARSAKGDFTTGDEILDEWGYVRNEDETLPEVIDNDHLKRFDDDQHQSVGPEWQYGFYLWRTTRWDGDRLLAWQSALIGKIDFEVSPRLVVGLMGGQAQPYSVKEISGGWVVFLNVEAEITEGMVIEAAHQLQHEISSASEHNETQ